jgi:flagellar basal-body rod protein FlgB
MSLFDSSTVPILQRVVEFTEARHGVLAGNIANLDTPGYKTRDLSPEQFMATLKEAIETRDLARSPRRSPYGEPILGQPANAGEDDPFADVKDSFRSILRHDEADVSIEQQVMEVAKNQSQHNLALSLMISQFRLLEAAISERV